MFNSLTIRIFLVMSLLVALGVGGAAAVTVFQGNKIAYEEVLRSLDRSRAIQHTTKESRFQNLLLINQLIASDSYFAAYISEAAGADLGFEDDAAGADAESIIDLIEERQENLEYQYGVTFDFAYVLDAEGYLLATTDRDPREMEDYNLDPVIAPLIADLNPVKGYWNKSRQIYQVVGVPLASNEELVGFLILGLQAADKFVNAVRDDSNTEFALLGPRSEKYYPVSGSLSQDATVALAAFMAERISISPNEPFEIELEGERLIAIYRGLTDVADTETGVSVSLLSLDQSLEGFKELQTLLILVAVVSIGIASGVAYLLALQIVKPLVRLATAAQDAARGDYYTEFEVKPGQDEVAVLTSSFDTLLSDLREKSDMENFMMSLSRLEPESDEEAALKSDRQPVEKPAERPATLLGIDFRDFNESERPPKDLANLIEAANRQLDVAIKNHGGVNVASSGYRSFSYFSSSDALRSALNAVVQAFPHLRNLGVNAAVAISRGKIITASIRMDGNLNEISVGKPWTILERLLTESKPGYIVMTKNTEAALSANDIELKMTEIEGSLSRRPFPGIAIADMATDSAIADDDATLIGETTTLSDPASAIRLEEIRPGMVLNDRYEVIAQLGSGGMGVVYKTYDKELDDVIALKLISTQHMDPRFVELMKTEIRLARRVTDPNILRTFDFGEVDGLPYLSMEYVRGMTLKYVMENTELPFSAALQIAKQLCNALIAAHTEDIMHRDVKPANLILDFSGRVKLMDFGLAGTNKGSKVLGGTPRYASPEQLLGEDAGPSADIYSCGVVLYELFTGKLPFDVAGRDAKGIVELQHSETPEDPSELNPGIPPALESLIMSCIKPDISDRPATVQEILDVLETVRA